ncbi:MAG TPA: hypothetical protein VGR95_11405 [Thermoanaerobaculia bacterium]|jgi:hypothetical protein|nr:hypothetical protein [Thermoanaerobaculia bacterium]
MNQLVFLTAFLGLTMGIQPVRLSVGGSVAAVEIRIDGQRVAQLDRAPWQANVDFGSVLAPHRMVAIGRDRDGNEVARAEQKVNLPRPASEATLLFDNSRVRVHWNSVDGKPPAKVSLRVDDAPLPLDSAMSAELPKLSPGKAHFFEALIESAAGETVEATALYGGASSEENGVMTAVPVVFDGKPPRDTHSLDGAFDGRNIVAIDDPPAEVIVIRDPSEAEAAIRYGRPRGKSGYVDQIRGTYVPQTTIATSDSWIGSNGTVRFLWPFATRVSSGQAADLFPSSRPFDRSNGGFRSLLTSISSPVTSPRLRYADAVSVAGLQALVKQRPRAVVLIIGTPFQDQSELTAKQARDFLASVGVPLFVWSLDEPRLRPKELDAWQPVIDISTEAKLQDAVRALRTSLEAQRIVWVAGDYLPREIALTPKGSRMHLLAHAP